MLWYLLVLVAFSPALSFPIHLPVLHDLLKASYTPRIVACPDRPLVRNANGPSARETEWINARQSVVAPLLLEWLRNSGLEDFDKYYAHSQANIALAFSGGGYRAMLTGAGQLAALDSRTTGSMAPGHLGGLLQATTYISGLSGGSWLLSSVVTNHWATVENLRDKQWHLKNPMQSPYDSIFENLAFYGKIALQVLAKLNAGFDITMTDVYGRALSQQLYAEDVRDNTWSGIQQYPEFINHQMPFPVIIANGIASYTDTVDDTSVIYEFNPFEMGSWDHELGQFTDMQYLGSSVMNGKSGSHCIENFDNIGFLSGTSSSLFNGATSDQIYNSSDLADAITAKNSKNKLSKESVMLSLKVSSFRPNPFYNPDGNALLSQTGLQLADGGEDGENVPIAPFVQSSRKVDIVFAFDNSADTLGSNGGYPNGTSLVMVANRKDSSYGSHYAFPPIPSVAEFVAQNLTSKLVFFGCDGKQINADGQPAPLIVYLANTHRSFDSNMPTMKLQYTQAEVNGMIQNGYNIATGKNGTLSSDWQSCVACAVVLRDQQRKNQTPSLQCAKCFTKYCWAG